MTKEKRYKWRREGYRENTKGLLMVNTGDGKGKTTCALGLMMRAAGRGMNCCMIQFMKSKTDRYGEHESLKHWESKFTRWATVLRGTRTTRTRRKNFARDVGIVRRENAFGRI
jgi:ATP:corrinoid adenosyltransferase